MHTNRSQASGAQSRTQTALDRSAPETCTAPPLRVSTHRPPRVPWWKTDEPKSVRHASPSSLIRTLPPCRSPWTMPRSWRNCSPEAIWPNYLSNSSVSSSEEIQMRPLPMHVDVRRGFDLAPSNSSHVPVGSRSSSKGTPYPTSLVIPRTPQTTARYGLVDIASCHATLSLPGTSPITFQR